MIARSIGEYEMDDTQMDGPPLPAGDASAEFDLNDLDLPLSSPALERLLEEVQSDELSVSRSYNRTYNRHNR